MLDFSDRTGTWICILTSATVFLFWPFFSVWRDSGAEFPVYLSNHVGFTPWLHYSSTPHSPEGFIPLEIVCAQDAWLHWSYENLDYFVLWSDLFFSSSGPPTGDVRRLLADGVGAAVGHHRHADQAGGAGPGQVWPVLARPRHRKLRGHVGHADRHAGAGHLRHPDLPSPAREWRPQPARKHLSVQHE